MKHDSRRETPFADLVDRVVAWPSDGPRFADAAFSLSSATRLAVLEALVAARGSAVHIQEVGRRVGVDASPARQHLEVLVKAGLAEEETRTLGRERRFTTRVTGIKIIAEGALGSPVVVPPGAEKPKALRKVEAKIESVKASMAKLRAELADLEKTRARIARETAEAMANGAGAKPARG